MARTNGGIIGVKNSTSQGGGKQTLVTSTSNLCTQPGTRIVQALIVSGGGGGGSQDAGGGGRFCTFKNPDSDGSHCEIEFRAFNNGLLDAVRICAMFSGDQP